MPVQEPTASAVHSAAISAPAPSSVAALAVSAAAAASAFSVPVPPVGKRPAEGASGEPPAKVQRRRRGGEGWEGSHSPLLPPPSPFLTVTMGAKAKKRAAPPRTPMGGPQKAPCLVPPSPVPLRPEAPVPLVSPARRSPGRSQPRKRGDAGKGDQSQLILILVLVLVPVLVLYYYYYYY